MRLSSSSMVEELIIKLKFVNLNYILVSMYEKNK